MSRPNILLVLCDQLQVFMLGCYGNGFVRTPNLDRLAHSGVRFETSMCVFPVCMASRSSLLAGQFNRTCTGGIGNVAYPSFPGNFNMPEYPFTDRPHLPDTTLPESLQTAGYHTAAIGKWHIHSWPHDIGFDEYVIPRVHHCHSAQHYCENGGPEFVPEGWSLDFEVERAGRFFREREDSQKPFFLYFNISPPHCPVADIPESFRTMYEPAEVPFRANVDPAVIEREDWHYQASVLRHDFRYYGLGLPCTQTLPEGYDLRALTAEYMGAVSWVDDAVGRLLDHLEHSGLAENTLVVFSSDHGEFMGSHGRFQKGAPHDESARVPLLMRWPGHYPAEAVRTPVVSLLDLAPTLLTAAGAPVPDSMVGESLDALARSDGHRLRDDFRIVESSSGAAIRTREHLYAAEFTEDRSGFKPEPSLFVNNLKDPLQQHNLAGTGAEAEVAATLRQRLEIFHSQTPWMGSYK
ncbi:MAG: sulfatase [Opitutales bacterium]